MQAYDSVVFIQHGKSEFNLLCLITFITSMEAYSMALHPVDLSMYFIQLRFPTKILYFLSCSCILKKGRGKLSNACRIVVRKPTHKYLFLYIYFKYPISWNLIGRVRYRKFVVLFVKTPYSMPEYMFCVSYLDL